MHLDRKSKINL